MKSNIKKKNNFFGWGGFVIYFLLLLLGLCAWIWISWNVSTSVMQPILFFVVLIVIFYCDNSGIRLSLTKRLPKSFPFHKSLAKRRKIGDRKTQYYKTFTYLSLLLSWVSPYLRFIFTATAIILPVLAIYRYIRYNDTISFSGESNNDLSPTVATILTPSVLFLIWGINNHEYNTLFWSLLIVISFVFIIPFFVSTNEYKHKKSIALGFSFCIVFFTFGSLCIINSDFDFSNPKEYSVTIVDKYISSGKSKTLYITVTPWDQQKENIDIEVDKETYKAATNGQTATVVQRKGVLDMSWYFLVIKNSTE